MSFLTRRKLHRHRDNPLADNFNLGALPEDDTASLQTPSVLQTPSIKSTNLRKRLSSFSLLASTLKRGRSQSSQQQPQAAVGFISPFRARSRSRSPSPPPSLEIRRPSGLGRRASVIDLLSGQASDHAQSVYGTSERKHSISTPELTLRPNGLLQWSHLPDTKSTARTPPRLPKPTPIVTRIPTDLLKTVFSFADLADLASAARVCKAFVEPVRVLLYEHIGLVRAVDGRRVEKCVSLLASRRDLAGLVQQFACDAIPPMHNAGGRTAFSVVTFAIALNNMHSLSSLTIPRFDAPLLFHTTFHLSNLTVLCDRISNDDIHGTFDWLRSQPSLTSLSFPNLVLEESNLQLLSTASSQQESPSVGSEQDAISPSLFAPDVLPKLAELRGPSSLAAALVPGRPLTSVQLQIHSTIYDGLRPSAILAGIAKSSSPVTRLGFKASPQTRVDARTIERLLMSAGSELGAHVQTLEIECALEDEVLRKLVNAVLPRYKTLHTLHLHRSNFTFPSTPPPTPSSSQLSPITPPSESSPSPLPSPSPSRPTTGLPPRAVERAILASWSRHCGTLRTVIFPSSAEWSISETAAGQQGTFTFLGTRSAEP